MGIVAAIGRKLGIYPAIWKPASSKLAVVDLDPAGFIEGIVYSGSEPLRGGDAWIRRWERGRGVAWQREGTALHYQLPVFGGLVIHKSARRWGKRDIVAADTRTGDERWRQPFALEMDDEPWSADGSLVLIAKTGEWEKRDPASGVVQASGAFRTRADKDAFLAAARPAVDHRRHSTRTDQFDQAGVVESWFAQRADAWSAIRSVCQARCPGWSNGSELVPLKADPVARTVTILVHSQESYDQNHVIVATIDPIGQRELSRIDIGKTGNHSPRPTHPYVQSFGERAVALDLSDARALSRSGEEETGQVVSIVDLGGPRLLGQISAIAESWIVLPDGGRQKFSA